MEAVRIAAVVILVIALVIAVVVEGHALTALVLAVITKLLG